MRFCRPAILLPCCSLCRVDSENYGLYMAGENGKIGKFLAEERLLGDYALSGPVATLQFKYKRRTFPEDVSRPYLVGRLHPPT